MGFFKALNIWYRRAIAATLGGAAGFAYYYYIGCASGTCPITSNPYISVAYGMLVGAMLINKTKEEKTGTENGNNTGEEI